MPDHWATWNQPDLVMALYQLSKYGYPFGATMEMVTDAIGRVAAGTARLLELAAVAGGFADPVKAVMVPPLGLVDASTLRTLGQFTSPPTTGENKPWSAFSWLYSWAALSNLAIWFWVVVICAPRAADWFSALCTER